MNFFLVSTEKSFQMSFNLKCGFDQKSAKNMVLFYYIVVILFGKNNKIPYFAWLVLHFFKDVKCFCIIWPTLKDLNNLRGQCKFEL